MPREDIPNEALEGLFVQATEKIYLVLLTIEQAEMPINPLRIVSNGEDIVSRGDTFSAVGFKFTAPGDGSIEQPKGQLEVDNTNQEITDALDSITTPAKLKIEVVLYNPDGNSDELVQVIEDFTVRSFTNDLTTLKAPLLFEDIFGQRIPADVYDPTQNPGLF